MSLRARSGFPRREALPFLPVSRRVPRPTKESAIMYPSVCLSENTSTQSFSSPSRSSRDSATRRPVFPSPLSDSLLYTRFAVCSSARSTCSDSRPGCCIGCSGGSHDNCHPRHSRGSCVVVSVRCSSPCPRCTRSSRSGYSRGDGCADEAPKHLCSDPSHSRGTASDAGRFYDSPLLPTTHP